VILDVHGLEILDAIALENAINGIPGVVTVGCSPTAARMWR
jgi:ribose 5-phosphate isomerase A